MRLSIIIPIYNVTDYIIPCLDSVVKQRFDDMECILVDDCGSDDSVVKAQRYIQNYHEKEIFFKLLHHERNRGLSAARNTGVTAATGEYILFLDSDDMLAENALQNLFHLINLYGSVDIVQGVFSKNGTENAKHMLDKDYYIGNEAKDAYLYNDMCLTAWNKLIKSSVAKKISFIEGIINEDNPWSFQIFEHMNSLCVCHEVTYIYRITPNSIMNSPSYQERSIKSFMTIYDFIISEMESMKITRAYPLQKILNRYVFGFILMPKANKDTFITTNNRLLQLYKQNKKHLSFRDFFVSIALYLPFPYNAKYALLLKSILNRMCKLRIINYG